jgi:hypothetical protein
MKTPPVKVRFVVLGVTTIVAVVSCCNFPSIVDTIPYAGVEIGHPLQPGIPGRTYVEWKDKGAFEKALERVRGHHGEYCLCVIEKPGDKPYKYPNSNCHGRYDCPPERIRTVRVTKSKAADNIAAGESAVNDPSITYKIQSADSSDISAILDTLK